MKLVKFADFGATLETRPEGYSIRRFNGKVLGVLPTCPDPASFDIESYTKAPMPIWAASHSINTLLKFDHDSAQLMRDRDLSEAGRSKRMGPIRDEAVKTMSAVYEQFGKHKGAMLNQEIHRYAVPALDRTDVVGYLRDRETRDAIRGMGNDALKQITGNSEFILSVLRSPIPLQPHLAEFAKANWRDMIDVRDPVGRATLNHENVAIDWAERILGTVRGTLTVDLGFSPQELLEKTSALNAAANWGFGTDAITHADRQREYRAIA